MREYMALPSDKTINTFISKYCFSQGFDPKINDLIETSWSNHVKEKSISISDLEVSFLNNEPVIENNFIKMSFVFLIVKIFFTG